MRRYAKYTPTRTELVRCHVRIALGWPRRALRGVPHLIGRYRSVPVIWHDRWSRIRRRAFGAPQPPAGADYLGWRVRWLADSTWCRVPGNQPDIEVSRGCQGTVGEYVQPGGANDHGYRITFDNGAVLGAYLPAPRMIQLERPAAKPIP